MIAVPRVKGAMSETKMTDIDKLLSGLDAALVTGGMSAEARKATVRIMRIAYAAAHPGPDGVVALLPALVEAVKSGRLADVSGLGEIGVQHAEPVAPEPKKTP